MDFILVGQDPSAERFVREAQSRGHRLVAFWDTEVHGKPSDYPGAVPIHSLEDVSSFGKVDFVLLAGRIGDRADRLRTLFRTEPYDMVLAVPQSDKPDVYYELSLWQRETETRVLPLIDELFHPGLERLLHFLGDGFVPTHPPQPAGEPGKASPVPPLQIEMRLPLSSDAEKQFLEGWHWLRAIGGEITSISTLSSADEPHAANEVMASARFQTNRIASIHWSKDQNRAVRLKIQGLSGEVTCELPEGFAGPSVIKGHLHQAPIDESVTAPTPAQRWLEAWERREASEELKQLTVATRQVELAAAVRRSLKYQRAVSLEYDEFSEEASFKGIMATAGCGLIWGIILIAILSVMGVPFVHYLVLPSLLLFLLLQVFVLVFKKPQEHPNEQ